MVKARLILIDTSSTNNSHLSLIRSDRDNTAPLLSALDRGNPNGKTRLKALCLTRSFIMRRGARHSV